MSEELRRLDFYGRKLERIFFRIVACITYTYLLFVVWEIRVSFEFETIMRRKTVCQFIILKIANFLRYRVFGFVIGILKNLPEVKNN